MPDPPLLQLPFGPFVPIQAELGSPWRVAAHLQKQRPKIDIVNIEIVVVHVDRIVARELELSVDLLALKCLRLLLRHPVKTMPS